PRERSPSFGSVTLDDIAAQMTNAPALALALLSSAVLTRNSVNMHDELAPEHFGELTRDCVVHGAHFGCLGAEHALEGPHASVGDTARNDGTEVGEVGRDVECETVRRDPSARDADADCADLLVVHPHAGKALHASRRDVPGAECAYDDFLD